MHTILVAALVLAGHRNLFQYVEPPLKKSSGGAAVSAVVVVVEQKPAAATAAAPQDPPTFEFPYRDIGSFGPDSDPIAVFVGGDVVTVRAGDAFADFVLQNIGLESVVVTRGEIVKRIELAPN